MVKQQSMNQLAGESQQTKREEKGKVEENYTVFVDCGNGSAE